MTSSLISKFVEHARHSSTPDGIESWQDLNCVSVFTYSGNLSWWIKLNQFLAVEHYKDVCRIFRDTHIPIESRSISFCRRFINWYSLQKYSTFWRPAVHRRKVEPFLQKGGFNSNSYQSGHWFGSRETQKNQGFSLHYWTTTNFLIYSFKTVRVYRVHGWRQYLL